MYTDKDRKMDCLAEPDIGKSASAKMALFALKMR